jgi:hypothetical protein
MNNLSKCAKCDGVYIEEEFENHICGVLALEIFDTDGNRWGSYDRINLFRLPSFEKLSDDRIQPAKNNPSDEEEYRTHFSNLYLFPE